MAPSRRHVHARALARAHPHAHAPSQVSLSVEISQAAIFMSMLPFDLPIIPPTSRRHGVPPV